jgi:Flp pilus assembly protein TadD
MELDPALQRAAGLFSAGQLDEARAVALSLAASDPANFLAQHLLGAIALRAGRPAEALEHETRALALRPGHLEALCNRGIALRALDRVVEALADYDRVLAARPDFVPALSLRGVALAALNRHAEAIECYSRAIAIEPHYAPAHLNKGLSELVTGDFDSGWRDFEWRWTGSDTQIAKRPFTQPQWRGENARGKTVLIHAEQGLGDAIQVSRYIPAMIERGIDVVLEVPPALEGLLSQLGGRVVRMGEPLPAFDLHCPILSLPLAFGTRLDSIPATVPYLRAPAAHAARWRDRLGPRDRTRVGLAWSGSTTLRNDRNRTLALSRLGRLRDPRWSLVSLQKEIRDADRAALASGEPIRHFGDQLEDFLDTAALIEQLDVVISVDTAVAHLAGALGKPVWILLPFSPDWRWLLDRDDSPWYPTAKLFRQPTPGDWDSVVARAVEELLRLVK